MHISYAQRSHDLRLPAMADGYGTPDDLVASRYLASLPPSPSTTTNYARPMVVARLGDNNEVGYELLFPGSRARYVQYQLGRGNKSLCDAIARAYMNLPASRGLRGDGVEVEKIGCGWAGNPADPYALMWARI